METRLQVLKLVNITSSPGASSPGAVPSSLFTSGLSNSCESKCGKSPSRPLQPVSGSLSGSFPPGNMFRLLPWSWMCLQVSCSSAVPRYRACGGNSSEVTSRVGRQSRQVDEEAGNRSVQCVGTCLPGLLWITRFSNVLKRHVTRSFKIAAKQML